MSFGRVFRGGLWLSIGVMAANVSGFLYWMFVSPLVSPAIVGKAATVLAVESLILSTISLGIPVGVVRFLGMAHGKQDSAMLAKYFYSAFLFMLVLNSTTGLTMLTLARFQLTSLEWESMLFASVLIVLGMNGWPLIIISLFNSILRTEYVGLMHVVVGLTRIAVGVPLVYIHSNFYGVMLGYVVVSAISDALLLFFAFKELRKYGGGFSTSMQAVGDSLKAGMATWFPTMLALSGQWLGVLGLSFVGSRETGTYFIAYSITMGLLAFPMNLLSLMFPVLSGMEDGRKGAMNRAVTFASAATYPICFIFAELTRKIAFREGELGNILAEGGAKAAKMLGDPDISMFVKGMSIPAYDPRGLKGFAVAYSTSPRGACHLRAYTPASEILGIPYKTDPLATEGKVDLVIILERLFAFADSLDMCKFSSFAFGVEDYAALFSTFTGIGMTPEELLNTGERILTQERYFNQLHGFSRKRDRLPKRFMEVASPSGPSKGHVIDEATFNSLMDEYYRKHGWNMDGTIPQERLIQLAIT